MIKTKPFLQWMGGKQSILPELKKRMPEKYNFYYELFLGAGSLYFEVMPKRARLNDINWNLINTYDGVKFHVDEVIELLKYYQKKHSVEFYYKMRNLLNKGNRNQLTAALMIYLNKACFNGLYRENSNGEFNTPIGTFHRNISFNFENLKNCSKLLNRNIESFYCKSFAHFEKSEFLNENDFFYLDPPYIQKSSQYNKKQFDLNMHERLSLFCLTLDRAGAYFMLSNSNNPEVLYFYNDLGFKIETIESTRHFSRNVSRRGKQKEVIIRNYE